MTNLSKEQILAALNDVTEMLTSQQPAIDTADVLIEALRALPDAEKENFMKRMAVALTPTVLEVAAEFRYEAEDFSVDITYDNRIEISEVEVNMRPVSDEIEASVASSFVNLNPVFMNEILDDL